MAETYYGDGGEKFSGACWLLRRFVEGFSRLDLPLTQLLRKGENYVSEGYERQENCNIREGDSLQLQGQLKPYESVLDVELCVRGSGGYWARMLKTVYILSSVLMMTAVVWFNQIVKIETVKLNIRGLVVVTAVGVLCGNGIAIRSMDFVTGLSIILRKRLMRGYSHSEELKVLGSRAQALSWIHRVRLRLRFWNLLIRLIRFRPVMSLYEDLESILGWQERVNEKSKVYSFCEDSLDESPRDEVRLPGRPKSLCELVILISLSSSVKGDVGKNIEEDV
ncbi:hypothetical protein Tco_0712721 [Tanacetum coccineum]